MTGATGAASDLESFVLPLQQHGAGAYYAEVALGSTLVTQLLVDTGSSYVVLTPETFRALRKTSTVRRLRKIRAAMAGGRITDAQVYEIPRLAIGPACELQDVEVVVLSGATRNILGLSALRRMGRIGMRFDPPALELSFCPPPAVAIAAAN